MRRRGLALMIVLMVTTLMAMLTGSFLMISRSNSSLSKRSDKTLRATQCCFSALDYVRSRLQHQRSWATAALGARQTTVSQSFMRVEEEGSSLANNLVEGQFPGSDERFQVRLVNNLGNATPLAAPTFSRRDLDVPGKSALVVIEGYAGFSRRHLEVLLRNDFFASSPLAAGTDLGLTTRSGDSQAHIDFTHPLPEQNSVKSRGKTYMPQADQMNFGSNPNSGAIAGKDDVVLNSLLNIDPSTGLLNSATGGDSMDSATAAQKKRRRKRQQFDDSSLARSAGPNVGRGRLEEGPGRS
jgi:hypothetical protein